MCVARSKALNIHAVSIFILHATLITSFAVIFRMKIIFCGAKYNRYTENIKLFILKILWQNMATLFLFCRNRKRARISVIYNSACLIIFSFVFINVLFIDAVINSEYIASNESMINEQWIVKDLEGSCRSTIKPTVPAFAWMEWEKQWKTSVRIISTRTEIWNMRICSSGSSQLAAMFRSH